MKILQQIIYDILSKWRETTPFDINLKIMDWDKTVQHITGNNSYSALIIRMERFLLSSVPLLTLDLKVLVYDPWNVYWVFSSWQSNQLSCQYCFSSPKTLLYIKLGDCRIWVKLKPELACLSWFLCSKHNVGSIPLCLVK